MTYRFPISVALLYTISLSSCDESHDARNGLFREVGVSASGLEFINTLTLDSSLNVFIYRNYYNGGGVAIGDVDGDGLEDIYLTANQLPNKLFKNLGELRFADITEFAGVAGHAAWSTGVAMADVNGDGHLDIYICNSGDLVGNNKRNELFINSGDGTFEEAAEAYGLADEGFSTHASFFDFDHDGDLDCYMLNNSFRPISTLGLRNLREVRDPEGGDKLYRNDDGRFVDISDEAGIYGSVIGFGLGISIGDVTNDGWEDIYISNDFYERDYLYVNDQNGGFEEELTQRLQTISNFSMGADIADLDNDGLPEIFVTDMLPREDKRIKQTTKFATPDDYYLRLERGFHHQAMRNTLQHNLGDGTFAEVGQMLGVAATDWSWGALLADFDNNGYRDIFVCNGAYKDVTDQDFLNFMNAGEALFMKNGTNEIDFDRYVDLLPSRPQINVAYANLDGTTFADSSANWGFTKPTSSNGAAYADFDHDGDLDLVVNNLNAPVQLFQNQAVERGGPRASRLIFKGTGANPMAIGARADFFYEDHILRYEHLPVRGFQSSMTYEPLITLPQNALLDSAIFTDPYGNQISLRGVTLDSIVDVDFSVTHAPARPVSSVSRGIDMPWRFITSNVLAEPVLHTEDVFNEFDRDRLLYWTNAFDGPSFAIGKYAGTINGIMYLGGSASSPGRLMIWDSASKKYRLQIPQTFVEDRNYEDGAAVFFDYDGDGDDDLLVSSSGSEFFGNNQGYPLRLYEQRPGRDGQPSFLRPRRGDIPIIRQPIGTLAVKDLNGDGMPDVVLAGRLGTDGYGRADPITILLNDGGRLVPNGGLPMTSPSGDLVSAIAFADVNGDGTAELVAVGEFMPISIYYSKAGLFDSLATIAGTEGLYRSILALDTDGDGTDELVCGNIGTNTFLSSPGKGPLTLYVGDIDNNGQVEHLFGQESEGTNYPLAGKHELEKLIPSVKKGFLKYSAYADKTMAQVFPKGDFSNMLFRRATQYETVLCKVVGSDWSVTPLPAVVQTSVIMAIAAVDADGDGDRDLILGGNLYGNQPRLGPLDASRGTLLINEGGTFVAKSKGNLLGLYGQVRHLTPFVTPDGRAVVAIAKNQGQLEFAAF